MKRREFFALVGSAVAWPFAAQAQQPDRVRRIGMLYLSDEGLTKLSLAIFRPALERLGWLDGKNVTIEHRLTSDANRLPSLAEELVALRPDVIFAATTPSVMALKRVTDTIPIVFVNVANPLANGIVQDLARPGANVTGFANSVGTPPMGKHLELLKELNPNVSRTALMFNPKTAAGDGGAKAFLAATSLLKIEPILAHVRDDAGIESAISALAREPNGALVVTQDTFVAIHRAPIIASTARHKVPTAYPFSFYCSDGGLISYGVDVFLGHREAATYVDRILKGEKPGDLPVQQPTKLELVINLKTAKALGLTVPASLLARADEVIE